MNMPDRLTVIETKLKYMEKLMYGIAGLILAQMGVSLI